MVNSRPQLGSTGELHLHTDLRLADTSTFEQVVVELRRLPRGGGLPFRGAASRGPTRAGIRRLAQHWCARPCAPSPTRASSGRTATPARWWPPSSEADAADLHSVRRLLEPARWTTSTASRRRNRRNRRRLRAPRERRPDRRVGGRDRRRPGLPPQPRGAPRQPAAGPRVRRDQVGERAPHSCSASTRARRSSLIG